MSDDQTNGTKRYVTSAELSQEIKDLREVVPTRWEVRALILGAVVVSNVVPPINLASKSAASFAGHIVGVIVGWF